MGPIGHIHGTHGTRPRGGCNPDVEVCVANCLCVQCFPNMTVGFLYGAGAETLIFVTGTSGKYPKLFVSRQKKTKVSCGYPENQEK